MQRSIERLHGYGFCAPYGRGSSPASNPFNAVINGSFDVAQIDGNSFTAQTFNLAVAPLTERGIIDMWLLRGEITTAGWNGVTFARAADSPILGVKGLSSTWNAPILKLPVAAEWLTQANFIDLLSLQKLVGKPATLTFSVKSPFAGRHYVTLCLANSGPGGATFVMPYTVSAASTWEKVTIALDLTSTIPLAAIPAASSVFASGTVGATLHFPLAVGSNFHTTVFNAWNAAPSNAFVGADCPVMTVGGGVVGATPFRITDVAILQGNNSTYPRQAYQTILNQCMAYWWNYVQGQGGGIVNVPNQYYARIGGIGIDGFQLIYPVPMAFPPVITPFNIIDSSANWRNQTQGANSGPCVAQQITNKYAFIKNTQVIADNANDEMRIYLTADARLA